MITTIILILIYVALVFIAYGMMIQEDRKATNNFACSAIFVWATVPFLLLITFGKCVFSVNDKLNNKK